MTTPDMIVCCVAQVVHAINEEIRDAAETTFLEMLFEKRKKIRT